MRRTKKQDKKNKKNKKRRRKKRKMFRISDVAEAVATRKDRFVKKYELNSSVVSRDMCYL